MPTAPNPPFFRAAPEPGVIAGDKDPPRYEPSLRDLPPVGPPIRGCRLFHHRLHLSTNPVCPSRHPRRASCVFTDGFLRATSTSDAECCICDPTLTKSFANLPIICRFAVPAFTTFSARMWSNRPENRSEKLRPKLRDSLRKFAKFQYRLNSCVSSVLKIRETSKLVIHREEYNYKLSLGVDYHILFAHRRLLSVSIENALISTYSTDRLNIRCRR